MPDITPILALPVLVPNQAQPYVTHNGALRRLDVLVQLSLASFGAETPPALPEEGEVHALGAAPTAAWAGHPLALAAWIDGSWLFLEPQVGWRAWGRAEAELRVWDGSGWALPPADLDNVAGLGIATSPDSTNRLSVRAAATLLSHDGGGHQLKINKAAAAETASLLFQSNWTGHAEIGLAGGTGFAVKVSPDGSAWTEALAIGAASGRIAARGIDLTQPEDAPGLQIACTAAGFAAQGLRLVADRAGDAGFDLLRAEVNAGASPDTVFRLAGDGNGSCDGSWTGGGADYAEWFEWADGNPGAEDRTGLSVVLDGARIRPAQPGEIPVGVISAAPALVGDGDTGGWKGKYLRDDFGRPLRDAAGQRRLTPAFDPAQTYIPRAARPEWDRVGLLGKLRLRQGQPVAPGWIRMRGIGPQVEEWLVR